MRDNKVNLCVAFVAVSNLFFVFLNGYTFNYLTPLSEKKFNSVFPLELLTSGECWRSPDMIPVAFIPPIPMQGPLVQKTKTSY